MTGQNSTEIWYEQKKLKTGYTTGSCAAAATKAALEMLLSGNEIQNISLLTPKSNRTLFRSKRYFNSERLGELRHTKRQWR